MHNILADGRIDRLTAHAFERGERAMLLRQLRIRFGELPESALARVKRAGFECLEWWGERVLTAKTLEEVLDKPI